MTPGGCGATGSKYLNMFPIDEGGAPNRAKNGRKPFSLLCLLPILSWHAREVVLGRPNAALAYKVCFQSTWTDFAP